jgi:hypothetical protein
MSNWGIEKDMRSEFRSRLRILSSIAKTKNEYVVFPKGDNKLQRMFSQLNWFVKNGYLEKHTDNPKLESYKILIEPTLNVIEEFHDESGEVTKLDLVAEVNMTWKQFVDFFDDVYLNRSDESILLMLSQLKYGDYNSIEVRDDIYIDCYDSDFKYKRPHVIFTVKKV